MSSAQVPDHRLLGKVFGFSPCCIEFFSSKSDNGTLQLALPGLRSMGGLRLCPTCSRKSNEEVIDGIRARRIAPTPFPTHPGPEHWDAILNHPVWTSGERELLMENRKFVVAGSSKEEMLALSFHVDMSALESAYATKLSQVPERESYLYVECELAKKELLSEFVNQIHALLKVRIAYQVRSGAIKL